VQPPRGESPHGDPRDFDKIDKMSDAFAKSSRVLSGTFSGTYRWLCKSKVRWYIRCLRNRECKRAFVHVTEKRNNLESIAERATRLMSRSKILRDSELLLMPRVLTENPAPGNPVINQPIFPFPLDTPWRCNAAQILVDSPFYVYRSFRYAKLTRPKSVRVACTPTVTSFPKGRKTRRRSLRKWACLNVRS